MKEHEIVAAPRRYQAAFFADLADLRPSVDTIPPLLEAFADRGFLPNTYRELGISSSPAPQVRLRLSTPDSEWEVDFETHRINITKNAVKPFGSNLGSSDEFTRNAIDFLERILKRFPMKGKRLSFVTSGLMTEMPEDRLREIYPRVFVPLDFYEKNPPSAWTSHSVSRILTDLNGNQERLNIVTQVGRIQGELTEEGSTIPYDRIQLGFDINTYQRNREPRFEMAHVRAFYPEALQIRENLLSSLKERLNV